MEHPIPTEPLPSKLKQLLAAKRAELVLGTLAQGAVFPAETSPEQLRRKVELAVYFERCQLEDEIGGEE